MLDKIKNFYPIKNHIENSAIIKIFGDHLQDNKSPSSFIIESISSIENLKNNSLLFISKKSNLETIYSNSIHIITDDIKVFENNHNVSLVKNLNLSYCHILNYIFYHEDNLDFPDEFIFKNNSYISIYSKIDPSAQIGNNSVIGRGCEIGKNNIIKNNVVIKNSILGDNITISDNTVIGSSGFGFDPKSMGSRMLFPHIGIVIIEDNVYIGSNCTIDRGKIDFTKIGSHSMLDNQIHIAHNVILGSNACIAGQSGISGSVKTGSRLTMGGQSGIAGHLKIGNNVTIAAKSGVIKNLKDKSVVAGFPAIDLYKWKKNIIKLYKTK